MYSVNLKEAETQLAKLVEEAARGEDVIITRSDGTSFRIIPVAKEITTPKFGSAKGLIKIADDFVEPLEEFEAYAP
ncbi:MAG: type II toxin-antitoxin system prevent-host-death family antitoxin [Phormidesmis sp.]